MDSNKKKILVSVDGSGHALDTVRYLSRMLPPHGVELVLFCVLNKEPEIFLDSAENPSSRRDLSVISRWQLQQKDAVEKFMENARRLLMDGGVPAEAVEVKIQERKVGIARDIIAEAQKGYEAVVTGRQGMNPITRLVIGSVASKLIQSLTFVPLWLIGKTTPSNKILVAVDASEGAMRAVKHIGRMVGGSGVELTLFRVIRGLGSKSVEQHTQFLDPSGRDDLKTKSDEDSASYEIFEKASQLLEEAGIHHDQITTKIVSGVATRSGSIIAQAASGGYGTVVLGRRGHSKVGEFYMGRVTNKVIQLAGKMALWVVS